ncbi:MAG: ATP/GTP-binding protein [Candidatus Heimdallarchaeota archaeon]|nr:MAG: ATP/GTP-binding protein [Candidatus Heimdallarchaeota archaeon]
MSQEEELVFEEAQKGIKIVFWGPTLAGKTTALSLFHAIKKKEDPESVYNFLKLEDKATERTIGFDQATFGLGTGHGTGFKYHLFTTPGQDRFKSMRKIVVNGLHGLIVVIDSESARWEENKDSLTELFQILGEKLYNREVKMAIILNKMDLPAETRISAADVGRLMLEAGISDKLRDTFASTFEVSCLEALEALKDAWGKGEWNPKRRPQPVQRIIQPIQMVIRDILVSELRKG